MTPVPLRRYSKPRGAGDQTSGGRGKLLRAHGELTRLQILVRETLQNSWDARDEDRHPPAYGIHVRRADGAVTRLLREQVFTDLIPALDDLTDSVSDDRVHLVEIFDRGTTGLTGPVHPDEAVPEGEPSNFNAFVFDIGSTKPLGQSGGTFGFGKTATFEVSAPHAVVYWTRCDRGDGELEDRLIASALHDPYVVHGKRFTGAHWWGDPGSDDDVITPLRGEAATALGESLFQTHFGEEETGTSILVIDPLVTTAGADSVEAPAPVRTAEQAAELGRQLLGALMMSAWPKLVPEQDGTAPMIIRFDVYGESRDVASLVKERFRVLGHGLGRIRREQRGDQDTASLPRPAEIREDALVPIRIRPPTSRERPLADYLGTRTDHTAGHLYIAKALRDPLSVGLEWRSANECCLMRSLPELVVNYEPLTDADDGMYEWFAVFKPTPECDHHFAASEPSTHDAWNRNAPESPVSKYVVDRVQTNVRKRAREFLNRHVGRSVSEARSARQLARSLSSFLPLRKPAGLVPPAGADTRPPSGRPGHGTAPANAPGQAGALGGPGGAGRSRRAAARRAAGQVVHVTGGRPEGDGAWRVEFEVRGDDGRTYDLELSVSAVTSEGDIRLAGDEMEVRWLRDDGESGGTTAEFAASASGAVVVRPALDASVKIDLAERVRP